jgi:amino acid transporter
LPDSATGPTGRRRPGAGYFSFVEIGRKLGGSALGVAMLASALLGNLALYLDYLASGARPLFAISSDALFPRGISRVSRRWGTPIAAILLMAVLNAVLIIGPFRNLVVIDVILFISSYVLIFLSAVSLRIRLLGLDVGWYGIAGSVALLSGPVCYVIFRRVFGGPSTPPSEAGNDELRLAAVDAVDDGGEIAAVEV